MTNRERGVPRGAMTLALIYTRVSSHIQEDEGVSLPAQLAACRKYAAAQGWIIGQEYTDVLSGKRDDRPAYQRLLHEIRQLRAEGKPIAVVVMRLDRLGRRLIERLTTRDEFKKLGVPVHSVKEGEVNDMVAGFLAVMAEEEVRQLGERVTTARRHIVDQGWSVPGRKPLGYRWRDATTEERAAGAPKRVLEEDPDTSWVVRELFARAASGESLRTLAQWLTKLPRSARGGKACTFSVMRKMLGAGVYIARRQGTLGESDPLEALKQPVQKWPAIVTDDQWRAIHERYALHRRVPLQASGNFLLTGLIRCPKCGTRMSGVTIKARSLRYRCQAEPFCRAEALLPPVDADVMAKVTAVLERLVAPSGGLMPELRQHWQRLEQPDAEAGAQEHVRQLEQSAARARDRIGRGTEMYVDGNLTREQYDQLCQRAEAEIEAADKEIERLLQVRRGPTLPPLEVVLRQIGGWLDVLRAAEPSERRPMLAVLIDRVVPERIGYGKYRAKITWTATGDALRTVPEMVAGARVA